MRNKCPEASVIIPAYNYAAFIRHAIESVLQQDYPMHHIEIIVIDDGSTDDTKDRLEQFIAGGDIHYYYQPNGGKAAATKKGIELAKGEIIFNLDADDYFLPGKLKKTMALFKADPSLVHVGSPALIKWEDGSRPDETEPIPGFLRGHRLYGEQTLRWYIKNKVLYGGGSTFAARSRALQQIQWDDAIDMYTDEWLLIQTLMKGDSYLFPEPLSAWRIHGKNYSGTSDKSVLPEKHERLEKSSQAILRLLGTYNYPRWLVKAYRLKHEVRKMVWLEERGEKSLGDISRFFARAILSGNSIRVLQNYHAFNRLAPQFLLKKK